MKPCTLYEALATVPDPRSRQGRIHPLPAFLGLVALALLMGRKSLKSIARFGRQHQAPLAHALGFRRGKTPSASTLSRTLRRFDAEQLEAARSRWIRGRIDATAFAQISLDGKTLRGSRDGDVPGQHLVAAYAPAVEAVLSQIRVDSKTNEHKAALELLGILPLAGKVVVGDAMFCQRDLAERVVAAGGDYLLVVKDNQPGLEIDIRAGFAFEHAARGIAAATSPEDIPRSAPAERVATTLEKGHGRIEKRTMETTPIVTMGQKWKGRKQGLRITRERTVKGKKTVEVVYGITSLSMKQATAATLLAILREHWRIENGLHYVRDVTLGEDACRVRSGAAPQVLAALRNAVIHLLTEVDAKSRPEAIEILQLHPEDAGRLIGIPQCE